MSDAVIAFDEIDRARVRLANHLQATPLVYSPGLKAWLKLETQAPTGSFKARPALNSILANLAVAEKRGVLASSSGNFAAAVAWAARKLGVSAVIVTPSNTSPYKIERTRALGAEVVVSGPSFEERWELTYKLERETGRLLLHPYDSVETIAGDGTVGLEIASELSLRGKRLRVVVPAGGGGLVAGIACAVRKSHPEAEIFGVQPRGGGALARSLEAGKRINVGRVVSIADALVASMPGERAFEAARELLDGVVLVDDEEIRSAVRWLCEEQKLVAEPGGAVAVAALRSGKLPEAGDAVRAVCVVSGGNIDPKLFAQLMMGHGS